MTPEAPVRLRRPSSTLGKTFCEFFAGIGLIRAGLEPSGWTCVYANDFDPKKQAMYQARFGMPDHYHLEDVGKTKEVLARIEDCPFLATASFPCVDLSLAGHYRGFEGTRSSTFFAFVEVLRELGERRPKLILLENVNGFLTANKGEDFKTAAIRLAELGYWLDVFILDACHFTPQSRPRVFVLGVVPELRPPEPRIHPGGGVLFPHSESPLRNEHVLRFIRTLQLPTGWVRFELPEPPQRTVMLPDVLDKGDDQDWWDQGDVKRHYHMMSDLHRLQVDEMLSSGRKWIGTIFRRFRHKQMRAEVRFDGLAGCLRTPKGGSAKQIVIMTAKGQLRMRWMSPQEYARLQVAGDFPMGSKPMDLLWGFADAVCVPAITWIDQHVLTPLYKTAVCIRRNSRAGQPHTRAAPENHAGCQRPRHLTGEDGQCSSAPKRIEIPTVPN